MFGPVELEKTSELPRLDKKAKNAWWGANRIIDVGGKLSGSEAEDSDSGEEPAPADEANTGSAATDLTTLPICYHQMPPIILKEIVWSNNIKHVLDLSPSPSTAGAAWLIGECGASYCALASTETSAEWLKKKVHDDLMELCSEEGTKLHGQCQVWAGMSAGNETTQPKGAPPRRRPTTGGGAGAGVGGIGGDDGAGGGGGGKRTPRKTQNTAGKTDGGNPDAVTGASTGGGALDIGALLAAAKAKAKAAGKEGTAADPAAGADAEGQQDS